MATPKVPSAGTSDAGSATLNVDLAKSELHKLLEQGLLKAGQQVLKESNEHVPKDTGDLEKSGKVTQEGLHVAISYGTDHAVIEHEDLTAHHEGSETAKFLENAWGDKTGFLPHIIAETVRNGIGS